MRILLWSLTVGALVLAACDHPKSAENAPPPLKWSVTPDPSETPDAQGLLSAKGRVGVGTIFYHTGDRPYRGVVMGMTGNDKPDGGHEEHVVWEDERGKRWTIQMKDMDLYRVRPDRK